MVINSARQHRLVAHPEEVCRELVGDLGPSARVDEHVAAGNVDLLVETDTQTAIEIIGEQALAKFL